MTISSTVSRNTYAGSGTTGPFPYSYRIFAATDLVVVKTEIATGIATTLAYVADYTVASAGNASGSVTLTAALAVGYTLSLTRTVPVTQPTDIRNQGSFFAATHEDVFDRLTMIDQQQQDQLARSLTIPVSDAVGTSTTLPAAAQRANKFLAFDGNGLPLATAVSLGTAGAVSVSTFMSTVLTQATALAAQLAFGISAFIATLLTAASAGAARTTLGGVPKVVTNMTALRALATTDLVGTVLLLGYTTAGDLGGGLWWWNASDVTADNIGTVVQPNSGGTGRWNRVRNAKEYNVQWFGGVGDNATNDQPAILAAATAALAAGGGDVVFPNTATNKYFVSTVGSVNLPVPVSDANFQPVSTAIQYHFYFNNVANLRFVGNGVSIRSATTSGGQMVLFNGAQNITWDGVSLESVMAFNSGTGVITTAGMGGLSFTSTTRDSYNITIDHYNPTNCYEGLYAFGDPASAFRVRGIRYANVWQHGGDYGVATHDNGDLVTFENVRVTGVNARAYFVFGVDDHKGSILNDGSFSNKFGLFLIKAYDRDTTNIEITAINKQISNTGSAVVTLQSQHNPVFQPTPNLLRNITVTIDDSLNTTGPSFDAAYYQNAALQATVSNTVWDNVCLRGSVYDGSTVSVSTVQSVAKRGHINIDNLVALNGSFSILSSKGFYSTKYQTYNPALSFGGGSTGITYATQLGEYYVVGSLCYCSLRVTLTSKGSSTGLAEITLPIASAPYNTGVAPVTVLGNANMNGLTGALTGFVENAASKLELLQQGATSCANLQDTAFTNTSDLLISFVYPI